MRAVSSESDGMRGFVPTRLVAWLIHRARQQQWRSRFSNRLNVGIKVVSFHLVDNPKKAKCHRVFLGPHYIKQLKNIKWHRDEKTASHRIQGHLYRLAHQKGVECTVELLQYLDLTERRLAVKRAYSSFYLQILREIAGCGFAGQFMQALLEGQHHAMVIALLNAMPSEKKQERITQVVNYCLAHAEARPLIMSMFHHRILFGQRLLQVLHAFYQRKPAYPEADNIYYKRLSELDVDDLADDQKVAWAELCRRRHEVGDDRLATYRYAVCLSDGVGIARDRLAAMRLLRDTIAEADVELAVKMVAYLKMNFHYLRGSAEAYVIMAACYRKHARYCLNIKVADQYEDGAARLGCVESFKRLYGDDLSVPQLMKYAKKDYAAAVTLLKEHATTSAKIGLHTCTYRGLGVRKSIAESTDDSDACTEEDVYLASGYSSVRLFDGTGQRFLSAQLDYSLMLLGVSGYAYGVSGLVRGRSYGYYERRAMEQVMSYTRQYYLPKLALMQQTQWRFMLDDLEWSSGLFSDDVRCEKKYAVSQFKARLDSGSVIHLSSGTKSHAVLLSLFKIGDHYYLAYANKGQTTLDYSAIRMYRIGYIHKLWDREWLESIIRAERDLTYLESFNPDDEGIGKYLGLQHMATLRRNPQNGLNCTLAATHHAVRVSFLVAEMRRINAPKLPMSAVVRQAYDMAKNPFKAWRFAMRECALKNLCDLGDVRRRVHIPSDQHVDVLMAALKRIFEKYGKDAKADKTCRDQLLDVVASHIDSEGCEFSVEQRKKVAAKLSVRAVSPGMVHFTA